MSIGKWGVFLYFPGIFFIPHYQRINTVRSFSVLFLTGLFYDHLFHHTFGFHAFIFSALYLIAKEFLHLEKKSSVQTLFFQVTLNLVIAVIWASFCLIQSSSSGIWPFSRFIFDCLLSTLLIVPISMWFMNFCSALIDRIEHSETSTPTSNI